MTPAFIAFLITSLFRISLSQLACDSFDLSLYRSGAVVSCHLSLPSTYNNEKVAYVQLPFRPSDESSLFFDAPNDKEFALLDYQIRHSEYSNRIFDTNTLNSLIGQDVVIHEKHGHKIKGRVCIDRHQNVRIHTPDEESVLLLERPTSILVQSQRKTNRQVPCSAEYIANITYSCQKQQDIVSEIINQKIENKRPVKDEKRKIFGKELPQMKEKEKKKDVDEEQEEEKSEKSEKTEKINNEKCHVTLHYTINGMEWQPKYRLLLDESLNKASLEMFSVAVTEVDDARCAHRNRTIQPKTLRFMTGESGLDTPGHHISHRLYRTASVPSPRQKAMYFSNDAMAEPEAASFDSATGEGGGASIDASLEGDRVSFAPLSGSSTHTLPLSGTSLFTVMAQLPKKARHPSAVERVLRFTASEHHSGVSESDENVAHPALILRIKNTIANALGLVPLPSGRVEVYRDSVSSSSSEANGSEKQQKEATSTFRIVKTQNSGAKDSDPLILYEKAEPEDTHDSVQSEDELADQPNPSLLLTTSLERDVVVNRSFEVSLGPSALLAACKWTESRTPFNSNNTAEGDVIIQCTQFVNEQIGFVPSLEIEDTLPFWGEALEFKPSAKPVIEKQGRSFKWIIPFNKEEEVSTAILTYHYKFKR
ncbi:uncharacterized protein MONOS_801 [Monocercomonoides exilis]|uniref:uncharacterized protein n=1 Tax=Monocercomonoides exilis TaxID=2049356 RepID=UPI0035594BDF|nr:hypothetical protein MONOS_801 [Monocercomonoides exilis]|eukprot:MONOS_801.1-p1 / transcript=MONOS_801.1 / gene=MONOS_801 / organism=Monocercomonoides_exilis_PA203 / gene_product=unspecified product / transcript_product=unspecified product / location=Mono_scaffold00013:158807-161301(+) / protein_length=650 / sequence_SO=supercontig / SO=protein_coding / is_pseudo=false